ncbi:MAG: hypothetical protein ACAI35_09925 [Candidatus Methylacidiphilales bacterium]|nr:hypothetical protein [Candidatus Methylacidiphilales bacterium]
MRLQWPKWLQRTGNRKVEPTSAISRLQKELEEQQARLRQQMEEVKTDLEPPPTEPSEGQGNGVHADSPPTIWHVEKEEESYVRPLPSTPPPRGRLGVQRRIERNRFLVVATVLVVIALIFYKIMS